MNKIDDFLSGEVSASLEDLNHQRTVIGLESIGVSQTLSAVTLRLPQYLDQIRQFVGNKLNPFKNHIDLVDSRFIEGKFRQLDYIQASYLGVVVPSGFVGTWLEHISVLGESQKIVTDMRTGLLKPFELYISELLNNPDSLKSNTIDEKLSRYKPGRIDDVKVKFVANYGNNGLIETTYGDVCKRHGDLPVVTRNLNDVNTAFASIDRNTLIKQVDSISNLLGMLIANIKEDPTTYAVSGACLKAITDLTYFMACEVEYYTTHGYLLETFTLSVKESFEGLKKAVSR
jgi:hypothetical protein